MKKLGDEPSLCKSTLPVADVPVLTRWINIVKECPRLMPLQSKVGLSPLSEAFNSSIDRGFEAARLYNFVIPSLLTLRSTS